VNDLLSEEQIRTAFAELRSAELPNVAPPGVDAARRAVRHGRQVRVAVAAHLAIAAVMAGGYLAVTAAGGEQEDDPAPQPAVSPTASTGPDDELVRAWADALYAHLHDPELAAQLHWALDRERLDVNVGEIHAAEAVDGAFPERSGAQAIEPGTSYAVRVGCAGAGTVTFAYRVGERSDGPATPEETGRVQDQLTAQCGETADGIAAGVAETTITVEVDQWLTEWVEPDAAALAEGRPPLLYASVIIPDVPEGSAPPPGAEPPDLGGMCDEGGDNDAEVRAAEAIDDGVPQAGTRLTSFFADEVERERRCGRTLSDTHDPRLETESYLVQVWCADEFGGSATVTLRAGGTEVTTVADCAMTAEEVSAGVGETVLNASSDHEIEVSLEVAGAAWADGARPIVRIVATPQGVELPRRPGS
jgi:hypothetical protein